MIYFDNAATTYHKPEVVIQAVVKAMQKMGNSGRGAHEGALGASRLIYETRAKLSDLLGLGHPEQISFTANATAGLNIVIQGIFAPGDHVITTEMEHNSVLRPLYLMQQQGVELTIIPVDKNGNVCLADFVKAIRPNTRGIVCTHASNLTGNVIDIQRVGEICREHQILFVLDASQSAGVLEINMQKMNIDIVCFTGHKSLLGPQGIGGIAVREHVKIRPLLVGGSGVHSYLKTHPDQMPDVLEAGTLNGHGIAGLHAALDYLLDHRIEVLRDQEMQLMRHFIAGVSAVKGVVLYGDFHSQLRAPIVTLNIYDFDSAEVADELQVNYDIAVRAGAHCAPLLHQALGTDQQGAVRFSFSHYNTIGEVDIAIRAVREIAAL